MPSFVFTSRSNTLFLSLYLRLLSRQWLLVVIYGEWNTHLTFRNYFTLLTSVEHRNNQTMTSNGFVIQSNLFIRKLWLHVELCQRVVCSIYSTEKREYQLSFTPSPPYIDTQDMKSFVDFSMRNITINYGAYASSHTATQMDLIYVWHEILHDRKKKSTNTSCARDVCETAKKKRTTTITLSHPCNTANVLPWLHADKKKQRTIR